MDMQGLTANLPVPHDDGSWVSERVSRIAELVREYDSNLDVRWIRPDMRGADEPAFAIVDARVPGREYVVFYVKDESEFDGRVLERLYQMDAQKHGNILTKIETENMAVKAIQDKLNKERIGEFTDFAYHLLKSKKHTYKHDGVKYE